MVNWLGVRPLFTTLALSIVWGLSPSCTKAPTTANRSAYNCETNPEECNGGVNPTSAGSSLDFTVPSAVQVNKDFDITWGAVPGAEKYDLLIGKDEKCTAVIFALRDEVVQSKKISMANTGTFYACLDAKNATGVVIARKQGYKFVVTSEDPAAAGLVAATNLRIVADSATGTTHSSTDDDTTIYFVWDGAVDVTNGIKEYSVKYYSGANCLGSESTAAAGTATSYAFASAAYNSTYSFKVIATNGKDETKTSNCSASTTISYPVYQIPFDTAGNYTYDNTLLSVSGGVATLLAVNQIYDDNGTSEFGLTKAHNNTTWDTDHLELKNAGSPDPRPLPNDAYYGVDATGMVFRLPLDDPYFVDTDSVYDDFGHAAVVDGTPTTENKSVKGKLGRALTIDGGGGDDITVTSSSSLELQNLTILAWIKTSDVNGFNIVTKGEGSNTIENYNFGLNPSGNLYLRARAGGVLEALNVVGTTVINDNKWYFVVAVVDGTNDYLYINGALEASDTHTGALFNDSSDMVIGSAGNNTFIDEVTIFSRALSATEISTIYQTQQKALIHEHWVEAPGLMDGNTLLLHLDEASGNLTDYSGRGHVGTPSGSPSYAQSGKIGTAITFTNTDRFDFTSALAPTGNDPFTACVWAYTTSSGQMLGNYSGVSGGQGWTLFSSTSVALWFKRQGITTAVTYAHHNNWYHICAVYDGTNQHIYGNGVHRGSTVNANSLAYSGTNGELGTDGFNGSLDEVAFWNRALSAQEIQIMYNLQSGNYRGNVHELPDNQSQTIDDWFPMNGNILLMHFNEGSVVDTANDPTIYDYSGGGNNGSFNSNNDGLQKVVSGKLDGAFDFDGTDDFVDLGGNANLQVSNISVAAWFKKSTGGSDDIIYRYRTHGVNLSVNSSNVVYWDGHTGAATTASVSSSSSVIDDLWHHAVGTFDGTNLVLYVDGNQVGTTPLAGNLYYSGGGAAIGRDGNANGSYFDGILDEVAIWNRALSADEVRKIYDHQSAAYSGTFVSDVIDTGSATASWTTLAWNMIRPYGKEMGASSDVSSSYSALPNDTLMNGNVLLLHLNETALDSVNGGADDIEDFSGQGNHGDTLGSMTVSNSFRRPGKFGYAIEFDGTDDYVNLGDKASLELDFPLTISAWVKIVSGNAEHEIITKWKADSSDREWILTLTNPNRRLRFRKSPDGSAEENYTANTNVPPNQWSMVSVSIQSDGSTAFYLNGSPDGSTTIANTTINHGDALALVGRKHANAPAYFLGSMDEVGVWTRALSSAEIQELYRRGASRIRYKVRSCDGSGCDDEPWIVPDSSMSPYSPYGEFFSELHNSTTSNPSLTFGGFGSHTVASNQFFQWKAYLDTSDTSEIPELKSVSVGSTHYYGGNPTIVTSSSLTFSSLVSFTETSSVGTVKYQLSNDGGTTWYWYNSAWTTTTTGYSESTSAADINTNIGTFPIGSGSLKVKAFLNSAAAAQATSLENVSVQYVP